MLGFGFFRRGARAQEKGRGYDGEQRKDVDLSALSIFHYSDLRELSQAGKLSRRARSAFVAPAVVFGNGQCRAQAAEERKLIRCQKSSLACTRESQSRKR